MIDTLQQSVFLTTFRHALFCVFGPGWGSYMSGGVCPTYPNFIINMAAHSYLRLKREPDFFNSQISNVLSTVAYSTRHLSRVWELRISG